MKWEAWYTRKKNNPLSIITVPLREAEDPVVSESQVGLTLIGYSIYHSKPWQLSILLITSVLLPFI